ncbi:MAG: YjjG family noncanonical pyrimidine nucleotidase [Clostridia bacterium]|nr:YjjG family noncanonical pyrimidine nucleotidase [Clostridia bacterium]
MKKTFLLFDVDRTLLDFDRSEAAAIKNALRYFGLPVSNAICNRYPEINEKLWEEFEKGTIEKATILYRRFDLLFSEFGITFDSKEFDTYYRADLSKHAFLIPGAKELLLSLRNKGHQIYYVTNGTRGVQYPRLKASGLDQLADGIFLSEEIGYQKPEKAFFDLVFPKIPHFTLAEAIIIGDSLSSDMKGGINVGLDTMWYNPKKVPNRLNIPVTYEVSDFSQIEAILEKLGGKI